MSSRLSEISELRTNAVIITCFFVLYGCVQAQNESVNAMPVYSALDYGVKMMEQP